MTMTDFKEHRKLWLGLTAALVLLIGILGARPGWYWIQDLTFY